MRLFCLKYFLATLSKNKQFISSHFSSAITILYDNGLWQQLGFPESRLTDCSLRFIEKGGATDYYRYCYPNYLNIAWYLPGPMMA
jgi:hypothetical protein